MHAIKEAAIFVVFVAIGAWAAYFLPIAVSILFAIIVFILAAAVLAKYF